LTFGPTLDTSEICNFQFEENNIYETYFSFFLAASKLVNNQVNSGWGSGGVAGGAIFSVDEDDGGWIKGPPGVGSGWMGKFPIPHMYFNCRFKQYCMMVSILN
jgi:hypothetical protein